MTLEPIWKWMRSPSLTAPDDIENQFLTALLQLPQELGNLREHLLKQANDPAFEKIGGVLNAVRRYDDIRQWRETLQTIAGRGNFLRAVRGSAMIDWEKGTISYSRDRLELALDDPRNDIRAIRQCSICGRIFYAGRLFYKGKEIEPYDIRKCGKKTCCHKKEASSESVC